MIAALTASPHADADAFAALYDRYATEICRYLFRQTAQWDLAEDLVAVVFLQAWRRRDQIDLAHEHVRAWLYGVAVNTLRNHRRALRRHDIALRAIAAARPAEPSHEEIEERRHDQRTVREVLASMKRMPSGEREAVALVLWSGLTYEEAAVALHVPVGTVRSRLNRARERLQRDIRPTLEER